LVVGLTRAAGVEEHLDPSLLQRLLEALQDFDATRLDPITTIYVHLTDRTLEAGEGVVRVEDVGPATLGQVRDWLTHPFTRDQIRHRVRVRPVLDADAVVAVDRYEFTRPMRELGACRMPFEVFPYGPVPASPAPHPRRARRLHRPRASRR